MKEPTLSSIPLSTKTYLAKIAPRGASEVSCTACERISSSEWDE